jgi:molybdate transport repressor ModE-like protein
MLDIEIETVWRFRKEGSPQTAVVMLGILNEIRKTGKLTSAAEHAHLSYRHVWNLVEQWSDFFGVPLVETQRGKGTRLTAFGEKLVWAGERMQARLGPQLENLAQELATEIKPFLHQRPSVIRVHASHGFAVSKLRELLDREPGIGVDLRYVSNQNSLVSLAQGACDLSGVHLPRGELRAQGIQACKEWLDPREDRVISFVTREMGLMVKRGNPLKINSSSARPALSIATTIQERGCCSTSYWPCTKSTKPKSWADNRWNLPMPRSRPMSPATWQTQASALRPQRVNSDWISSGF